MMFRIGVNLGDVIQDEDRIYGDGVNIAARVEGLADPGGVAISGTAFDNIRNKLDCGYEFSGEHAVKNIANPVRVYKILTEPECAGKVIGEKRFLGWVSRKVAMAAILALAIVTGGLVSYYIYLYQSGRIEPASVENMAFPLPDKPSIAVLPFVNMSGDDKQEYLSDGFTEDLITSISKIPPIFVISRQSSFTYKGKPVNVKAVAEDLGVRYVLEGSIQKAGDQIRINVQLIDALTGHHQWSERYDRKFQNIFKLKDEIIFKIATELAVELTEGERARLLARYTDNLEA
ncbi:MAG: adenylate/guanylate cyclase domain-containing protein, partial [Desulfobacterales bacterium]